MDVYGSWEVLRGIPAVIMGEVAIGGVIHMVGLVDWSSRIGCVLVAVIGCLVAAEWLRRGYSDWLWLQWLVVVASNISHNYLNDNITRGMTTMR